VYEFAIGAPMSRVLAAAGPSSTPPRALLVGGYYGTWLTPEAVAGTRLDDASLRRSRAVLGAGAIVALPADACPAAEVARVVRWMADQGAGQCGPCIHGLDAIAGAFESLVAGIAGPEVFGRLERWSRQVQGRGACRHPDGVVRFVASALHVFGAELKDHQRHGPCDACGRAPVLITRARRGRLAA
jgi:NADH:ubiquinone oxidoreductase subunit F (NADH-binding)